jgi:peptidyl-tRNA hydrolase
MSFYIIINDDLKMSKGKIISQIVHITHLITAEILRMGYEQFPVPNEYIEYMKWTKNDKTVILKGTKDDIMKISKNKNSRIYTDNNEITICALLPNSSEDPIVKSLKLL